MAEQPLDRRLPEILNKEATSGLLTEIYQRLLDRYGPQHWWPADEPFEVMVGAILTQSAAWLNVEKAIANLKKAQALTPRALRDLKQPELAALIRPSGYYNAKVRKLKALACWLGECYDDNLEKLFSVGSGRLRRQLLAVHGIGPETADSILLYAVGRPVFVIDAYARRIIDRIGLAPDGNSYDVYQSLFRDNLPADTQMFNEYHALLVYLGKDVCRPRPFCRRCCLGGICRFSGTNELVQKD